METAEISRLTGLGPEDSRLAAQREFDEPFLARLRGPSDELVLEKAAAGRGLGLSRGGRFHHLYRHGGKGNAMERLADWYMKYAGPAVTAALGDSPNDFAMLERADHPVLVKSERSFPELSGRIQRLTITSENGTAGWNTAVMDLLDKLQGGSNEQKAGY